MSTTTLDAKHDRSRYTETERSRREAAAREEEKPQQEKPPKS